MAWYAGADMRTGGCCLAWMTQEEDEDQDEDACLVEPEDKPPPVMRHQWMRGSIDDSQVLFKAAYEYVLTRC